MSSKGVVNRFFDFLNGSSKSEYQLLEKESDLFFNPPFSYKYRTKFKEDLIIIKRRFYSNKLIEIIEIYAALGFFRIKIFRVDFYKVTLIGSSRLCAFYSLIIIIISFVILFETISEQSIQNLIIIPFLIIWKKLIDFILVDFPLSLFIKNLDIQKNKTE